MNQAYKYTGKPLDMEKGLNLYYFGARYYNPAIGRWLAVDPLACIYPDRSPYEYCAGNPMKGVDADGRKITNPKSYILSNPILIQKLGEFDRTVARLSGISSSDYEFRISGGDRFHDASGSIRSLSTGEIVGNSNLQSTHLQVRGALAADLNYPSNSKITKSVIRKAASLTGLYIKDDYKDNHFHLGLPRSNAQDYLNNWQINRAYVPSNEDFLAVTYTAAEMKNNSFLTALPIGPGRNAAADYLHSLYPNYAIIVDNERYY